ATTSPVSGCPIFTRRVVSCSFCRCGGCSSRRALGCGSCRAAGGAPVKERRHGTVCPDLLVPLAAPAKLRRAGLSERLDHAVFARIPAHGVGGWELFVFRCAGACVSMHEHVLVRGVAARTRRMTGTVSVGRYRSSCC